MNKILFALVVILLSLPSLYIGYSYFYTNERIKEYQCVRLHATNVDNEFLLDLSRDNNFLNTYTKDITLTKFTYYTKPDDFTEYDIDDHQDNELNYKLFISTFCNYATYKRSHLETIIVIEFYFVLLSIAWAYIMFNKFTQEQMNAYIPVIILCVMLVLDIANLILWLSFNLRFDFSQNELISSYQVWSIFTT